MPTIPSTYSGPATSGSQTQKTRSSAPPDSQTYDSRSMPPSAALSIAAGHGPCQEVRLITASGQKVYVTACCADCAAAIENDKRLGDQIWNQFRPATNVQARDAHPGRGPGVDLGPAVDLATGTESTSKTELATNIWTSLPEEAQAGIITAGAGVVMLVVGGLLVKWVLYGERGRIRRATIWAFGKTCVGLDPALQSYLMADIPVRKEL